MGNAKKVQENTRKVLTIGTEFGILIERLTRGKQKRTKNEEIRRKFKKVLDKRMTAW